MSRLTAWVKEKGFNSIELYGNRHKESQTTTYMRNAACFHFKKRYILPVSRNMYLCEIVVILIVSLYIQFSSLGENAFQLFSILVLFLHFGLILLRCLSIAITDWTFMRDVRAISIKCKAEEFPSWVTLLPELKTPEQVCDWVLLEFRHRVYALSSGTLDLLTSDEAFRDYLTRMYSY